MTGGALINVLHNAGRINDRHPDQRKLVPSQRNACPLAAVACGARSAPHDGPGNSNMRSSAIAAIRARRGAVPPLIRCRHLQMQSVFPRRLATGRRAGSLSSSSSSSTLKEAERMRFPGAVSFVTFTLAPGFTRSLVRCATRHRRALLKRRSFGATSRIARRATAWPARPSTHYDDDRRSQLLKTPRISLRGEKELRRKEIIVVECVVCDNRDHLNLHPSQQVAGACISSRSSSVGRARRRPTGGGEALVTRKDKVRLPVVPSAAHKSVPSHLLLLLSCERSPGDSATSDDYCTIPPRRAHPMTRVQESG